jgi:hypothetical protein
MTPEALIKSKIRAFLIDEMGAYYFAPVQMGMGVSTLDILCCIRGKFVGIEVKVPGKKPTTRQQQVIRTINSAGGVAFWTDSLEHCKALLQSFGLVLP